jgi:Tol biopolymer transport system component
MLALGGLVIVALVSLGLLGGRLPTIAGGGDGGNGGPAPTAAPSNVIITESKAAAVPGTFVYAKTGNIWVQQGTNVRQLTTSGSDITPRFSPDGKFIYFIRTELKQAKAPLQGVITVTLAVPLLMRVPTDGSAAPERLASGEYSFGGGAYHWFYWLRQPTPSPDGQTLALVSDGPDPFPGHSDRDVILQTMNLATGKLTAANAPESPPLGHQDPAWRPDGKAIAYTRNARDAGTSRGAPTIWRYDVAARKAIAVTGPGYEAPSWSPDGRYLAVTKTNTQGTDVVIVDARTGSELMKVTDDGRSWAPAWSQNGDEIAFLHMDNGIVDLRTARLSGAGPSWKVAETIDMTTVSGLDGASRPDWFIPADKRTPIPTAPSPTPPTASGPPPSAIP